MDEDFDVEKVWGPVSVLPGVGPKTETSVWVSPKCICLFFGIKTARREPGERWEDP